jgi:hypothetical protein
VRDALSCIDVGAGFSLRQGYGGRAEAHRAKAGSRPRADLKVGLYESPMQQGF